MRALIKSSPKYYCPRCKSTKIINRGKYIECPRCGIDFFKEYIREIDDENILAEQELEGFIDSFEDLKDKKIYNTLLKTLEDDNL